MFQKKMAFFGVATVMATVAAPAMAATSMSNAASVAVVKLSNGDIYTYNISAYRYDRNGFVTQGGTLNFYRSTNGRISFAANVDKMEWADATHCKLSGNVIYQNVPSRFEFYLAKENGSNFVSWRIFQTDSKAVLLNLGVQPTGVLTPQLITDGSITLSQR